MESGARGRAATSGTVARLPWSRRAGGRQTVALWWTLPLLLAVLFVPLTPATAAVPEGTGKYYVVGPPVNGQREYLYSIALLTLGNGNRFREIIELNRGRKQPDGATFTDGVELAPGWILVLPRDADGPGVRTGALPAIGPPTPRPSPSTVAPSAPSPSPSAPSSPSDETPQPPPSTAPPRPADSPVAPAAAGPPSESEPLGPGRFDVDLIRVGAGALAVVLAVVAILVLPRRVRQMRSVALDDGPWPPQRHHTPTPAELDALAADTSTSLPAPAGPPPSRTPAAAPPVPAPPVSVPPVPAPSVRVPSSPESPGPAAAQGTAEQGTAGRRLADLRTAEHAQLRLAKPSRLSVPSEPPPEWPPFAGTASTRTPAESPGAAEPAGPVGGGRRTDAVLPRPALPVDGDVPYVRADVLTEVGPILVRLAGVTTGPATPAYAWLADDEPAPAAAVPLVLGRKGPWRLQVDLGRAPDVFTLVGVVEECRRLAAAYARQLHAGGITVAVVGDALGAETFNGCRRLTGLPEPGDGDSDPCVVIIAGIPGDGPGDLAAATGGRCIPVVIGPVPDGRWSVQLAAGD
ncbi:hypothetical protein [Micromonospora sp. NPDC051296]|uniref:hypothetical protein n=1 Tax=Micromonospora sp. NPDC051296 TaxID=3155046 RepID=UPI003443CF28